MFNLTQSKKTIKNELVSHYRTLISMMVIPILVFFVYIFCSLNFSVIYPSNSFWLAVISVLIAPFILSFSLLGIEFARGPQFYTTRKYGVIPGINNFNDYVDAVMLSLIINVFTFLWSLLLIVPGIVKSLSYSQSMLIFFDNKHAGTPISYLDAITESRKMMTGHKLNFLLFQLSFIGWSFISGLLFSASINTLSFIGYQNLFINILFMLLSIGLIFFSTMFIIWITFYIAFSDASYYTFLADK